MNPTRSLPKNIPISFTEKDVLIAETTLPLPQEKPVTLMGKASPLYNREDESSVRSSRSATLPNGNRQRYIASFLWIFWAS